MRLRLVLLWVRGGVASLHVACLRHAILRCRRSVTRLLLRVWIVGVPWVLHARRIAPVRLIVLATVLLASIAIIRVPWVRELLRGCGITSAHARGKLGIRRLAGRIVGHHRTRVALGILMTVVPTVTGFLFAWNAWRGAAFSTDLSASGRVVHRGLHLHRGHHRLVHQAGVKTHGVWGKTWIHLLLRVTHIVSGEIAALAPLASLIVFVTAFTSLTMVAIAIFVVSLLLPTVLLRLLRRVFLWHRLLLLRRLR